MSLQSLPGIGPKIEQKLLDKGITSISSLASSSTEPYSNIARIQTHFIACVHNDNNRNKDLKLSKVQLNTCKESVQIVSNFCKYIKTHQEKIPSITNAIRRSGIKRTKIKDGLYVIIKKIDDPHMIVKSKKSIETLWKIIYKVNEKSLTFLLKHFITIYDMFESDDKKSLYIIMEAMDGDGEDFSDKYRTTMDTKKYRQCLSNAWHGLTTGIAMGLFNNNLYFGDIKPKNIAYKRQNDDTFVFKWIDLECISNSYSNCEQEDFTDPHHIDVIQKHIKHKTPPQLNMDILFATDLYKIGLSILTMLDGENPIKPFLKHVPHGMGFLVIPEKKEEIIQAIQERVDFYAHTDIPQHLKGKLICFLDMTIEKRFQPLLS
jgi:serine/threonine protein kinase